MNWSFPDFTAPSNAEEIYNQKCGRKGVDVALVSHGGSEDAHTIFRTWYARTKEVRSTLPTRKGVDLHTRYTPREA